MLYHVPNEKEPAYTGIEMKVLSIGTKIQGGNKKNKPTTNIQK